MVSPLCSRVQQLWCRGCVRHAPWLPGGLGRGAGGGARHVLRARLLVQVHIWHIYTVCPDIYIIYTLQHFLLRAEHPGGGDLPRQPAQHHRGRLHGPQPGRQVLPGAALQHQPQHGGGADQAPHRQGGPPLLHRGRGVRRVPVRVLDICPVPQL